jgi:hypothetical protein
MKDKPVYWTPFEVGEALSLYLEGIVHNPRYDTVDENHRQDLGAVLNEVPLSQSFYCFGRARLGEARSILSRASRKTYGHLQLAKIDAPSRNIGGAEEGDVFDHQLLFARRYR